MCPWASHLYACDGVWWNAHYETAKEVFIGKMWTQDPGWKDKITWIESVRGYGLRKDALVQGENSGYQAINLAYILGAERVILLGYDMTGTGDHWFGKHDKSKGLSTVTNYSRFIRNYEKMQPEKHGLQVINSTRETGLHCFPRMSLEGALDKCKI